MRTIRLSANIVILSVGLSKMNVKILELISDYSIESQQE